MIQPHAYIIFYANLVTKNMADSPFMLRKRIFNEI